MCILLLLHAMTFMRCLAACDTTFAAPQWQVGDAEHVLFRLCCLGLSHPVPTVLVGYLIVNLIVICEQHQPFTRFCVWVIGITPTCQMAGDTICNSQCQHPLHIAHLTWAIFLCLPGLVVIRQSPAVAGKVSLSCRPQVQARLLHEYLHDTAVMAV